MYTNRMYLFNSALPGAATSMQHTDHVDRARKHGTGRKGKEGHAQGKTSGRQKYSQGKTATHSHHVYFQIR